MSKIGRNIKKIRAVKKINQNDFANIFGLSRASVGAYEEERAEPKIATILKISEHFKIPVDKLLKSDLQVNDISNFKIDDNKLNLGSNNLTTGKKLILKEMPIVSASTKKSNKTDLLRVPVKRSKSDYIAINDKNISICRKVSDPEETIGKIIYIETEKSFIREEVIIVGDELKLKISGEGVPNGVAFYLVESEIGTELSNSKSKSGDVGDLVERIERLERKVF
ncbi:MAG: helix-turn-helix transcriptional regulator [Crocinitomicaceae bacterium]|nr:helix-turn-helix transcriptional regulator [Crocinitomicaceae bacterium]